jgi:rare lipoprotein A
MEYFMHFKLLVVVMLSVALLACFAMSASAEVEYVTEYGDADGYASGALTASGAPAGGFSAASPDLPFGTLVQVCYDGCVVVVVTDSCACGLDLWVDAANAIGLPGGADCDVEILSVD